jgi:transcriptional regulator with XRE-family HTH domain
MKDIDELRNAKAEDFYYIGKRLREIRDDLVEADDTTDKRNSHYSRKNVCDRLGVDYSTLTNVERGTISPTTFKLILYYYSLGYNPMWIIATDNEFIPKRNIGENFVYQEGIQENFRTLESNILEAISEFKSKI